MRGPLYLTASLIAFAVATAAHAQDADAAPAAPAASADDIIVTARRVRERLQDVPVAITALQGSQLEALGVRQVIDIRLAVSGLNITASAGRTTTPIYAIRGQRASDTVFTQDPPVAVYFDEAIVTPVAGSNLGLFDLENIQVLKGPQGTLFGRNTTGGAILFTSAKPTDNFEGRIRLGYGNYDARTGTAVLNLPLSEQVRLRGAVDFTKTDGFGRVLAAPGPNPGPEVGSRNQSRDELNLRFTAAIDPIDWLKTITTVYYSRANGGGPAYQTIDTPNPRGAAASVFGAAFINAVARSRARGSRFDTESGRVTGERTRIFGAINTVSLELGDNLTFKNIFSYRRVRLTETDNYDGTSINLIDPTNVSNSDAYSEEAQFQGTGFDGRLSYVAGVYYYSQHGLDGGIGTFIFGVPGTQYANIRNSSLSGFGQATFKLTDTLNLTGGLRYTVDRRTANIVAGNFPLTACLFTDAGGLPLPPAACEIDNSRSFAEPSWLVSVDHKLGNDSLVYLSSRHSYRSGGFNARANSNGLAQTFFRPEIVTDVELGFKSTFDLGAESRLRTNIAAYYEWYKDIQRNINTVRNGVIGNVTQNAAKAHIYGLEAELGLLYHHLIDVNFNYAYVKPKYDNYSTFAPVNGVPNQPDDYSIRDFPYIARHQINASVSITPSIGSFAQLALTANAYYQTRIVFSEDFQNRAQLLRRISPAAGATLPNDIVYGQNGYALVNLRADLSNISGTGISVGAYMRNVFDKRYIDAATLFADSIGGDFGHYGDPRTFGVEATFRF